VFGRVEPYLSQGDHQTKDNEERGGMQKLFTVSESTVEKGEEVFCRATISKQIAERLTEPWPKDGRTVREWKKGRSLSNARGLLGWNHGCGCTR